MLSATRYAPSSLTRGLIDDAAIFPPGLVPLDTAVEQHRALRRSPLAPYIGPFLLRVSWWEQFLDLASEGDEFPFVLITRPDGESEAADAAPVRTALDGLARRLSLRETSRLRGVEMPLPPTDSGRQAVVDAVAPWGAHVAITFEIDGTAPDVDCAAVVDAGARAGRGTLGKFRTGGVRPEDSPPPERLAGVIAAAARQHVPIKFTAGLHHAVTGTHGPGGSVQFGVLNVMAAVRQAVSAGGDSSHDASLTDALSVTLMRTDAIRLAAEAVSLTIDEADTIRSIFTSFGCCGVTEPLAEMAALGVVPDRPEGPQA
jgi:hypothetical protein